MARGWDRGIQAAEARLSAPGLFILLWGGTFLGLIFLGRQLTFFADEWWFISQRHEWSLASFMAPHNGHWVLTTAIIWYPLLETIGLHSYMPYLAVTLAAHLLTAAAVYRIAARQAGAIVGILGAIIILVFGRAHEVLFQAFAFGLVGATAAGAWALALFLENETRTRRVGAAILLVFAIVTSGAGLFFVAAIAVVIVVVPGRRQQWWVVAPAVVAYAGWQATFGRSTLDDASSTPIGALFAYMQNGFANGVGALLGVGPVLGLIAAAVLAVVMGWDLLRRRRLPVGVLAGVVGLVAEFAIIGLARAAPFGPEQALAPRYAYMAGVFLIVALSSWLGPRLREGAQVREGAQASRLLPATVVVASLAIALNGAALVNRSSWWGERADMTRAVVSLFTDYGGQPAMPADRRAPGIRSDPWVSAIPAPNELDALSARYGSPLDDVFIPGVVDIPDAVYDQALFAIVRPAIHLTRVAPRPAEPTSVRIAGTEDLDVDRIDGCLRLRSTGSSPELLLHHLSGGEALWFDTRSDGFVGVALSARGTWSDSDTMVIPLQADVATAITLPDLGPGLAWMARIDLPPAGEMDLCAR